MNTSLDGHGEVVEYTHKITSGVPPELHGKYGIMTAKVNCGFLCF